MPLSAATSAILLSLLRLTLILGCLATPLAHGAVGLPIVLPAADFQKHKLFSPTAAQRIRNARNLSDGHSGRLGWVEYEFTVAAAGWHEMFVRGSSLRVEFTLDPESTSPHAAAHFYGGRAAGANREKIGNVWLTAGIHHLRMQHLYWVGFPAISAIEFKPVPAENSFAVSSAGAPRIFRKGQCAPLDILGGGTGLPAQFQVFDLQDRGAATRRIYDISFPGSTEPSHQAFRIPCEREGIFTLAFGTGHGIDPGLGQYTYEVIDTRNLQASEKTPDRLLREIDCSRQAPDYSGGPSRVRNGHPGSYREADERGWSDLQRLPAAARNLAGEAGWFAYDLRELKAQRRYRIEVDYPDDARRTFAIALRESAPLAYPPAIGVTSGGEYILSGETATQSMTIWPRAASPRLLFITALDHEPAACSRIRLYEAGRVPPLAADGAPGRRQIVHWYEEAGNYRSLFGPPDDEPWLGSAAAERWLEMAAGNGVNLLLPTAIVYGFALYPSRHEITFFDPKADELRRLLLLAEKHRIKLAPEIHPRADGLSWGYEDGGPLPENLLVAKDGKTNFFAADGRTRNYPPYFDPLNPSTEDWYLALISEIAERYKDSPAFEGISLRLMQWSSGAFNNLVSLDWGYGDATVEQFRQESGLPVPMGKPGDPGRFAQRHAWLTTTGRDAWINWRCRKISGILSHARDRLRQIRPDLKLYLHVFNGDLPDAPGFAGGKNPAVERLRESGIDPAMLREIEGVTLIDASYTYGRRTADGVFRGDHDHLLDPVALSALRGNSAGHYKSGGYYMEATETVVPPQRLGFPSSTKATWMSAVINPAGRHALERYAIQLAEADALMVGEGGNGYTFGPPVIREFLREYAFLPNQPFTARADAIDPVTVRSLVTKAGLLVYAVNRERYPTSTELVFNRASEAVRLSTGKRLNIRDNRLNIELLPYQLIVIRLPPGSEIVKAGTTVPEAEKRKVEARVDWARRLAEGNRLRPLAGGILGQKTPELRTLETAVATATTALNKGWLWRARTVLEHNALLAIYRRLDCFPPELFSDMTSRRECPP